MTEQDGVFTFDPDEIVYLPCKKCGSIYYLNADCKEMTDREDGLFNFEPDSCDWCNFDLIDNEDKQVH